MTKQIVKTGELTWENAIPRATNPEWGTFGIGDKVETAGTRWITTLRSRGGPVIFASEFRFWRRVVA